MFNLGMALMFINFMSWHSNLNLKIILSLSKMYTCMCVCVCPCVYCMCACVCMCLGIFLCVHSCVCINVLNFGIFFLFITFCFPQTILIEDGSHSNPFFFLKFLRILIPWQTILCKIMIPNNMF